MSSTGTIYKIFLSSPGDLPVERQELKKYIGDLKLQQSRFEAILWEDELASVITDDAQNEINTTLLDDCDMIIGLFKGKFGSKTARKESGTIEEIEESIQKGKPIMMYFLQHTINNGSTLEEIDNFRKITEFKEKYKKRGIYHDVKNVEEILAKWLQRDLEANLKKLKSHPQVIQQTSTIKNEEQQGNLSKTSREWYLDSISTKINEYLRKRQLNYTYIDDLTFHENLLLAYNSDLNFMSSSVTEIFEQARITAFNDKYGNYDYSLDIRNKYRDWYKDIVRIINEHFPSKKSLNILDVGGNSGLELQEIFGNIGKNCSFSVLDLSDEAIHLGQKQYSNITFYHGNMENSFPFKTKFDICLCLRAIQSRGVTRQDALIQMISHVKPGGLLILSIPDGYVNASGEIIRGLYDHRTKAFLHDRPLTLAEKISKKMHDYGFEHTMLCSSDTEIFVWGRKEN